MDERENELSRLVDQLNRSATIAKSGEKISIDQLLSVAVHNHASDLIVVAGSPATLRVNGELVADAGPLLSAETIRSLLLPPLSRMNWKNANAWIFVLYAAPQEDFAPTSTFSAEPSQPQSAFCRRRFQRSNRSTSPHRSPC